MSSNVEIVKEKNVELDDFEEPMDVIETRKDAYFEEGEIDSSEDEKDNIDQVEANVPNIFTREFAKTQKEKFIAGFDIFDKNYEKEAMKKFYGAKRFALPTMTENAEEVHKDKLSNLYRDLGIDKENERHYRFNTIHMRGTENMSTEDVLEYFVSYTPSHVEWINDVSCNVVWIDDTSAAKALLNLSKKIINLDKVYFHANPFGKDYKEADFERNKVNDDDDDDHGDDSVDARNITAAVPPGFWRLGLPSDKSKILLLRYATRSDKKQRNAEKNSEYYKKYGNPNFGNIPGILSKSLRSEFKKHRSKNTRSIQEQSQDNGLNNPWGDLAYEWGKTDYIMHNHDYSLWKIPSRQNLPRNRSDIPDLRISLTNKKEKSKRQRFYSGSSSDLSDEWDSKSKIPRMKMYADYEEEKLDNSIDQRLSNLKSCTRSVEDLRSKINRKRSKIRFRFKSEKQNSGRASGSETSDSENECNNKDYKDLRLSLKQSKKHESRRLSRYQSKSESDDKNYYLKCRSPLQIQIKNDEYFQSK